MLISLGVRREFETLCNMEEGAVVELVGLVTNGSVRFMIDSLEAPQGFSW